MPSNSKVLGSGTTLVIVGISAQYLALVPPLVPPMLCALTPTRNASANSKVDTLGSALGLKSNRMASRPPSFTPLPEIPSLSSAVWALPAPALKFCALPGRRTYALGCRGPGG